MTSSKPSVCRRILRWVFGIIGALVALVVLVFLAVCLIVRLPKTSEKVSELVSEYIDGDFTVGKMRLSFFRHIPEVYVSLEDVSVVTVPGDTLAAFDILSVRAEYLPLLKKVIRVPDITLEGLRADARCYEDGSANWNIFPSDTTEKVADTTALELPVIYLGNLTIGAPRLSFTSPNFKMSASLFSDLSAENTDSAGLGVNMKHFVFYSDGIQADLTASADSLLSEDPHFTVDGTVKAKLDRFACYIPEKFKVGGNIVLDVNADALLSQLCLERFPGATLDASLMADKINFLSEEDGLAAHLAEPAVVLKSPKGAPLFADISMEKLLFKTGDTKLMAADLDFKAAAGGDPSKMRRSRMERRSDRMERRGPRPSGMPREVPDFLSEKDFRLSDIHVDLDKSLSDLILKLHPIGAVTLDQALLVTPALPLRNKVENVKARFDTEQLTVENLTVKSGTTDISANATLRGLGLMLAGRDFLKLDANISSNRLNVNELLAALEEGSKAAASDTKTDTLTIETLEYELVDENEPMKDFSSVDTVSSTTGLIVVPANLLADVNIDAKRVDYASVQVNDFHSLLRMQERCLQIADLEAFSDICDVKLSAFYSTKTKQDINAGFNLALNDITADRVIELIPSVNDVLPMLTSFKGNLNCELAATSQLDTNMNFLIPSLEGIFKISGKDLVLEDLGSFRKVAKLLLFRDNRHGNIHDMSVNGTISDCQIKVYPFLLGVDRYNFALKGTQGFDQKFKYHISLIDTPIPFKIGVNLYGNSFDKMHWNLGRARYRSTKVPALYDEVEDMQINLATSIRDIFRKGVDAAMKENRNRVRTLDEKQETEDAGLDMEPMSEEEEALFEELTLSAEIDDLTSEILAEFLSNNA